MFQINIGKKKSFNKNDINEILTIKLKLRSKNNPNFIKLVGMTNVKLSQLVNNYENISWHNLYTVDS